MENIPIKKMQNISGNEEQTTCLESSCGAAPMVDIDLINDPEATLTTRIQNLLLNVNETRVPPSSLPVSIINSSDSLKIAQPSDTDGLIDSCATVSTSDLMASNGAPRMPYTGSIMCRICHNSDRIERLISPCLCKGTQGFVHRHCLEYWLSRSGILHCELCMHRYKTQSTLRYSCCESVHIWFRHPNNRGLLQSDLMVCTLLTIVTFGLVSMSLVGLQYFMMQGNRMGFSKTWTQGSLITFLIIILSAYVVNVFLIIRAQIGPWYRWWQSVRIVRVILPSQLLKTGTIAEKKVRDVMLAQQSMRTTEV